MYLVNYIRIAGILMFFQIIGFVHLTGQIPHCSAFVINSEKIYLGKNLDWELGNGMIVFNPANELKKSCISNKKWRSKYSSITFNHLGKNLPLGGMNEAGLVIEELSTWPCEYPKTKDKNGLNEFEWIQYNLDKHSSINEVIKYLDKISIDKFLFGIHYIAADYDGNCAIIEFIDGNVQIFTGDSLPICALTNNNYKELLEYREKTPIRSENMENSQDRFLKIVDLLNNQKESEIQSAMSILDVVKVSDTRWSIVYNISDKQITFRTNLSNKTDTVSFNEFQSNFGRSLFAQFYSREKIQFSFLNKYKNNIYLREVLDSLQSIKNAETKYISNKINSLIN